MYNVWKNVLAEIEQKVSGSSFQTWFKNAELVSIEGEIITIETPNVFIMNQLKARYDNLIGEAFLHNNVKAEKINYIVKSTAKKKRTGIREVPKRAEAKSVERAGELAEITVPKMPITRFTSGLNPKYTLDNFVVGGNNDLAVGVAKIIIQNPGEKYNPFFLYGGPGLGKSHLVQAIGNAILNNNPKLKVLYIPINHFYSDFINSIKAGKGDSFADKYRKLDVLIVDDFQFMVGKEKSQVEFFNIFNDLHQANRQIIITSDRLPEQIKTLDVRLSSRLSMAGAFDLQFPSFEDRCAILKSKAEFLGFEIEDAAIEFIAENIKTNIRDLEGEFQRIMAISEIRGLTPLELINDGFISGAAIRKQKQVNAKQVVEKVAKYYELTVKEMCGKSRVSNIKTARQVAMYILSKELEMSTPKIALEVGVKDHTTVMHGIKKIDADLRENQELREQVEAIKENIYE